MGYKKGGSTTALFHDYPNHVFPVYKRFLPVANLGAKTADYFFRPYSKGMARQDLTIRQGETWSRVFTWRENGVRKDLTGWTARMQIREANADSGSPVLIELSTAVGNARITLGGTAGTITMALSAGDTQALNLSGDEAVYDLELTSGTGAVTRLMEGRVHLIREVTR